MTEEGVIVAVRFALYATLGAAFGLSTFAVSNRPADTAVQAMRRRHRRVVAMLAAIGLVVSTFGILTLAKAMAGADTYGEALGHAVAMVAGGVPVGVAWVVRSVALVACVGLAWGSRDRAGPAIGLEAASGIALASLAWSGHGAMHGGAEGVLHLAADVAHLWAAGAWVGALFAFLLLAAAPPSTREDLGLLAATTEGFARTGTVLVAVLVATGLVNLVEIVGVTPAAWSAALGAPYGRLMLVKLALVGCMLALAAANRYRLSPRLVEAHGQGDASAAARLLRTSLGTEATLAVLVLAVVAWLGTSSPTGG